LLNVSDEHITSVFRVEEVSQARDQFAFPFSSGFLRSLLFDSEDGDSGLQEHPELPAVSEPKGVKRYNPE
jgi:hypothetical protein